MSEVNPNYNPLSEVRDEPVEQYETLAVDESVRPWGHYDVLFESEDCKVKRIVVYPGQRLSYQSHEKRSEQWVVVKGVLTVVYENREYDLLSGDSVHIGRREKHRAWNKTQEPVQFIEVQTGTYFGEDDITRYEDDYER